MQTIFVDRADPASRRLTVEAIARRSSPDEAGGSGGGFPQVLLFPEGTATNQRALITFKQGAFAPGMPVQPVVVRFPYRHLDPSYPAVSPTLLDLFLRMMCQFVNYMEVEYLTVYTPSEAERASPSLYAANVQRLLATHLGASRLVPATQHAYEDVALQFAAMKLKLPAEAAVVEWNQLRDQLQITTATAKEWMAVFKALDKDNDGKLSYEEFAAGWRRKHPRTPARPKTQGGATVLPGVESPTAGTAGKASGSPPPPMSPVRAAAGSTAEAAAGLPPALSPTSGSFGSSDGAVLEDELAKAFELFDQKGEGKVDFREFLTGLSVLNGMGKDGRRDAMKFALAVLDKQDRGQFTREELQALVLRLFPTMPEEQMKAMLDAADPDGRGIIRRDEFLRFAEQNQDVLGLYQAALCNDILGRDVDVAPLEQPWGIDSPGSGGGGGGGRSGGGVGSGGVESAPALV
ncbi:unnamed protein product [Phaeothamnion confervicola]